MARKIEFKISEDDFEILQYCRIEGESDKATFTRALHYLFNATYRARIQQPQTLNQGLGRVVDALKDVHFR